MYTYTEKPKKTDRSKKSNTIQRIKIRLDNTTHPPNNVLSHLEHFNFPNQGALVINANTLAGAGYRSNPSIGVAENIILLGHGSRPAGAAPGHGDAVAQAGYNADALAGVADAVNKPLFWHGSIILAGCNTAALARQVTEEYYTRSALNRATTVTGTQYPISVRDGIAHPFIGTDWSDLDAADRPGNYNPAFIQLRNQYAPALRPAMLDLLQYIAGCDPARPVIPSTVTLADLQNHSAVLQGLLAAVVLPGAPALPPAVQNAVLQIQDTINTLNALVTNGGQSPAALFAAYFAPANNLANNLAQTYQELDDFLQLPVDLTAPHNTPATASSYKRKRAYTVFGSWVDA